MATTGADGVSTEHKESGSLKPEVFDSYDAFIKENHIPASDKPRVDSAFAKARQERARPNDLVQQEDGQWVKKP